MLQYRNASAARAAALPWFAMEEGWGSCGWRQTSPSIDGQRYDCHVCDEHDLTKEEQIRHWKLHYLDLDELRVREVTTEDSETDTPMCDPDQEHAKRGSLHWKRGSYGTQGYLKARVPLPDGEGLGEVGSVYGTQTSDYRNARHLRERRNSLYEHLGCATPGVCMPSWKLTCLHNARMAAVRGGERASRAFEWVEGAARQGEETMGGARRPATDHSPQNSRGSRPGPAAGPPPRRCWETTRDVDPSRTRPRRKLKLCPKKRNCPRGRMQKRENPGEVPVEEGVDTSDGVLVRYMSGGRQAISERLPGAAIKTAVPGLHFAVVLRCPRSPRPCTCAAISSAPPPSAPPQASPPTSDDEEYPTDVQKLLEEKNKAEKEWNALLPWWDHFSATA